MMRLAAVLALSSPVFGFRVFGGIKASENGVLEASAPTCACSENGVVDGVNTGKLGCAQHFGQRYGYICYVENGADCAGARLSSRTGVYWRSCREEHLVQEAKDWLLEAMQGMDLHAIEVSINIANQRHVDQETITAAHARMEHVNKMIAAEAELMGALRGDSPERLQAALETAEELELDEFLSEDVLEEAVERFQHLRSRDDAEAALVTAINDVNRDDLILKLAQAREMGVRGAHILQQGDERVIELEHMMAAARDTLVESIRSRDSTLIRSNLEEANRLFAADSALQARTAARLQHLATAESAENQLLPTLAGVDLSLIRDKLAIARSSDADPSVVTQAAERISEIRRMMRRATSALATAVAADHDGTTKASSELQEAMAEIARLHCVRDWAPVTQATVDEAQARLDHLRDVDEATARVVAIHDSEDMHAIITGLAWGRSHGVVQSVIDRGEAQAARLRIMMRDARQLMIDRTEGNDANALQAALDEVRRLNAASPRRIRLAEERLATLRR